MDVGAAIFFTDYSITPTELAIALEERGFRVTVGSRTLAHPGHPSVQRARRRADKAVLRRYGPVRNVERCGCGHQTAEARYRCLSGDPARHHPDGETGRLARPGVEWALPVRHWLRLECRRNGRPRHCVRNAHAEDA